MGSPEELGEALREIRKRRGMLQSEMARRAGITKAMACCYERGRRYPSLATLDALLVALEVDLRVLDRALRYVQHRRARRRLREAGAPERRSESREGRVRTGPHSGPSPGRSSAPHPPGPGGR